MFIWPYCRHVFLCIHSLFFLVPLLLSSFVFLVSFLDLRHHTYHIMSVYTFIKFDIHNTSNKTLARGWKKTSLNNLIYLQINYLHHWNCGNMWIILQQIDSATSSLAEHLVGIPIDMRFILSGLLHPQNDICPCYRCNNEIPNNMVFPCVKQCL